MSEPIFNVVIGTAGHVDHGKSTLVRTLTGIDPDRLKEEQERGITIDLGFAPLLLDGGLRVGIIDVPGHERFVKNMVAGSTGIDFVMLVVAADDGVMAQTREHLQIVELLGVRDGLTVITKTDLVQPDYLELVVDDIRSLETGTLLDGKPLLYVSSKTGEGIAELKRALNERLPRIARRSTEGPFRMPIQRVFAKEGFGTVVTGVPLSGHVDIGDTLTVLPPDLSGRVKGIQAYSSSIEHGQAGHSTALNLYSSEIETRELHRGMVVATPGVFQPTALVTAWLTHLAGAPWPLKHRAAVRFHAGTVELQGKALVLEGDALAPGVGGWIQIALEEPTVLAPGDRFILRHQTPMVTLGGGRIVDVAPRKRKRRDADVIAELNARLKAVDDADAFVLQILGEARLPRTFSELCAEAGLLPQTLQSLVARLAAKKQITVLQADAIAIAPKRLEALLADAVGCAQAFFTEHPALGSLEQPELRKRLDLKAGALSAPAFDAVLALLKQRNLLHVDGNRIALPGRERRLEGALAALAEKVEAALRDGGLAPPSPAEIAAQLKMSPKVLREIMRHLIETGKVAEATAEIVFHQSHYDAALAAVERMFQSSPELTTSEIRQKLGMNRKYVIPLLELFDRRKFTVRTGDKRRKGAN